jgi:hypothetical protein
MLHIATQENIGGQDDGVWGPRYDMLVRPVEVLLD